MIDPKDKIEIEKIIDDYMYRKQFELSKLQNHEHNGVDCNQLSIVNLLETIVLSGVSGGVVEESLNADQIVVQGNNQIDKSGSVPKLLTSNQAQFTVFPIPVIYGHGVGGSSAFEGGEAKDGTMIFFENGLTLSGLWVKSTTDINGGWYRFAPTSVL